VFPFAFFAVFGRTIALMGIFLSAAVVIYDFPVLKGYGRTPELSLFCAIFCFES